MNVIENIKYLILEHFRKNKKAIILGIISLLIGVLIGVVLSMSDISFLSLLKISNQNVVEYINGTAKYFSIFFKNLANIMFGIAIIFVFCLNYYTSFLSYLYVIYQTCIFVLTISVIIANYSFFGIISSVVFLIPCNLLLFATLNFYISVCTSRAKKAKEYLQKFSSSFDADFWILILIIAVLIISLMIIINLVLPLILKGIYIINY